MLLEAIREGVQSLLWEQETFAYADRWDAERGRYLGLKVGQQVHVVLNAEAVLVKPKVAAAQLVDDAAAAARLQASTTMTYTDAPANPAPEVSERGGTATLEPARPAPQSGVPYANGQASTPVTADQQYRRFHGSVAINPRMMAGDAGKIMDEVVKHLTTLYGANVKVTLEIQASLPNGVPEGTVRTVEENCRTLRFESFGFEVE